MCVQLLLLKLRFNDEVTDENYLLFVAVTCILCPKELSFFKHFEPYFTLWRAGYASGDGQTSLACSIHFV
jgi:hypothetical protein